MSLVRHYDAQYGGFESELSARVRAETFGEDIGQNGWLTRQEQDLFLSWLDLGPEHRLLDVACGSGGPTLRMAQRTGASVVGVDIHEDGVARARARAEELGLGERARFERLDAGGGLPFDDGAFDAIVCIDAVNHLPDRGAVLAEWARLLRPGGRLLFTDPITVTGPLSNEEIAIRGSIGFFLFVPDGVNERLLDRAGLELLERTDRTGNMAAMAARWREVREKHAEELRRVEGEETFAGQQRFFEVAARLAAERRLSRFAFHARRRG